MTVNELLALIAAIGTPVREVMRAKEAIYKELDLLPQPQMGAFTKEDGEAVIDAQGRRV